MDLLQLLKKLPDTSLALNVLRPLLAKNEREVRQHVLQWVENIRQTPELDANTEEKLVAVMSQLIEQKFRSLTYKELSKMLRLTPLAETTSVQELLKEDRVETMCELIQEKLSLSDDFMAAFQEELQKLDMGSLKALRRQILHINTLEQFEQWITGRLSSNAKS
jgi:hypothetical protein